MLRTFYLWMLAGLMPALTLAVEPARPLASIKLSGNTRFSSDEIIRGLSYCPKALAAVEPTNSEEQFRRIIATLIEQGYRAHGYLDCQVTPKLVAAEPSFEIVEGKPYVRGPIVWKATPEQRAWLEPSFKKYRDPDHEPLWEVGEPWARRGPRNTLPYSSVDTYGTWLNELGIPAWMVQPTVMIEEQNDRFVVKLRLRFPTDLEHPQISKISAPEDCRELVQQLLTKSGVAVGTPFDPSVKKAVYIALLTSGQLKDVQVVAQPADRLGDVELLITASPTGAVLTDAQQQIRPWVFDVWKTYLSVDAPCQNASYEQRFGPLSLTATQTRNGAVSYELQCDNVKLAALDLDHQSTSMRLDLGEGIRFRMAGVLLQPTLTVEIRPDNSRPLRGNCKISTESVIDASNRKPLSNMMLMAIEDYVKLFPPAECEVVAFDRGTRVSSRFGEVSFDKQGSLVELRIREREDEDLLYLSLLPRNVGTTVRNETASIDLIEVTPSKTDFLIAPLEQDDVQQYSATLLLMLADRFQLDQTDGPLMELLRSIAISSTEDYEAFTSSITRLHERSPVGILTFDLMVIFSSKTIRKQDFPHFFLEWPDTLVGDQAIDVFFELVDRDLKRLLADGTLTRKWCTDIDPRIFYRLLTEKAKILEFDEYDMESLTYLCPDEKQELEGWRLMLRGASVFVQGYMSEAIAQAFDEP